jgi:hypothetical protein
LFGEVVEMDFIIPEYLSYRIEPNDLMLMVLGYNEFLDLSYLILAQCLVPSYILVRNLDP